ncbi:hypothetical protein [Mariprofundus ferrooxydans]|uniref:Uncharacterized protein n=1 Tax=Mariprofundus ferrooxydans PV-1 TaxID=314345 RepID=Q0F0Z6_9PROT|nr:hypothetical protein [Mariprofundus ferrooxydans]EAU55395.1 hypothetical protein SPV1_11701 [Mariprofundus ferrooxydans PV-1]KON47689.1 hypothetical protein AL013_06880 [Mariprofundus ferrooxydans]
MEFPIIEKIHIIIFSASIGFLGLLFAFRNRLADTKTRIIVEHGFAHELISEGNKFLPGTKPIIYVKVKNTGSTQRFIEKPKIWISRKINGEQVFHPAKVNDPNKYPFKLESGGVFKNDLNLNDFESQIGRHLKDSDEIRFVVSDTLGREYKSTKFRVKELRAQIEVARKVDEGEQ